jgi:GTP-binding protein YchF
MENLTPVRSIDLEDDDKAILKELQLITAKPMVFVCNVLDEDLAEGGNQYSEIVGKHAAEHGAQHLVICSKIEEELVGLEPDEREMFMEDLGIKEPGLDRLVNTAYDTLNLATYFTAGEKEVRAWTIGKGWTAPQAAGVIHTDFEKGFIRAEVAAYDDFVAHSGEKGCRDVGKLRAEGKEYIVTDGDVMHFLFN